MLTAELLTALSKACGGRPSKTVIAGMAANQRYLADGGIDTPERVAEWCAQACVETNYFGTLKELGGARYFAKYDNRRDLGNGPGDGARFPGRGVFQITGRDNHKRYGDRIGVDLVNNPVLAERPDISIRTSVLYWNDKKLSPYADRGDTKAISRAINRGNAKATKPANHEAERIKCAKLARQMLGIPSARRVGFASLPDDEPPAAETVSDEPKQVITNESYTDEHRVKLAQTWLRNLGYTEVGVPDGKLGTFTRGAIRDYRADKDLPPGDYLDTEMMTALAIDNEPRKMPEGRAEATPAEVRERVPEVKANFFTKVWSYVLAAGGAVVAFVNGILENFSDAREYISPVQDFLGDIPAWAWALGAVGIAAALYTNSRRGEKAGVEAFKDGSRR